MNRHDLLARARHRMGEQFVSTQVLGRSQTIGCVAVEITQKCNLDCTLCYLSEHSQEVRDIPLAEVLRRLDDALAEFGPGTHVQITGGDPTLRKHSELVEIVRYASELGLCPALFTNGIGASRKLLRRLADVGLRDVAFHVDTTQRRKGFDSESDLNHLREEYLERARGLGVMVIFNTTVHRGNFDELPALVSFFTRHADLIGLVSFNLQAETGRGEWGSRTTLINQQTVRSQVESAAEKTLPWDRVRVGHGQCHSYLPTLVINQRIHPVVADSAFAALALAEFPDIGTDRHLGRFRVGAKYLSHLAGRPRLWLPTLRYLRWLLGQTGGDLLRAGGRAHKLTFFIQNFMDAQQLDEERVDACSFMVMTAEGPVSMCLHNANRDEYILKPLSVPHADGTVEEYQPLVWRESQTETTAVAQGDRK
ncbi:MAG: radical SAM protein [Pseudomonadota bacterium]